MEIWYACLERPPAPGAVPREGLLEAKSDDGLLIEQHYWGLVAYNRKLTEQEEHDYQLYEITEVIHAREEYYHDTVRRIHSLFAEAKDVCTTRGYRRLLEEIKRDIEKELHHGSCPY